MRRFVLLVIAVSMLVACSDSDSGIRELARREAKMGADLVGNGDCRIVNTLAALAMPGAYIVYGTIRDRGREYRHLWAMDPSGSIVDRSCPPKEQGCIDRGYRAVVRVDDMAVLWTAPGDTSWVDSHVYAVEFVTAVRRAMQ